MKEDALHTVQKVRKPKEVSYTKTACHKLRCIFLLIGWFISKMTVSSVVFLDRSQKQTKLTRGHDHRSVGIGKARKER